MTSANPSPRPLHFVVTLVALIVIGAATLGGRDPSESRVAWCLTCAPSGSRVGVDLILNILLFVPYGFGLRAMQVSWPRAVAAVVVTSLAIELLQLELIPGRYSSIADVITNTTGGAMGIALAHQWRGLVVAPPTRARWLAFTTLAAWLALLAGSAIAATPALPGEEYVPRWRPDSPRAPGDGEIVTAQLNGSSLRPTDASSTGVVRTGLRRGDVIRLDVSLTPGTERPARIELRTRDETPRVVLGQNESDLMLRVHLRASDARLRGPTLRLVGALAATPGATRDDTVEVTGEVSRRFLRIRATVEGKRVERELILGPHLGWSFLLPGRMSLPPMARSLADSAWIAFLLLPAAFFARRSLAAKDQVAERQERRAVFAVGLFLVVAGLAVIPAIVGVSPVPGLAWVLCGACVLIGWAIGGRRRRTVRRP